MRTPCRYPLLTGLAVASLLACVPPGVAAPAGAEKAGASESSSAPLNRLTGRVLSVDGSRVLLEARDQRSVQVDTAEAARNHLMMFFKPGSLITVYGTYNAEGVLRAQSVQRAKRGMVAWSADR